MASSPQHLVPGPDPYDESWMLGTIFSAMAYGIVMTLSVCCLQLLWAKPTTKSRRLRWFMFAYILAMVALSTTSMVAAINSIVDAVFKVHPSGRLPQPTLPVKTWGAPFIILATWGADGFMVRATAAAELLILTPCVTAMAMQCHL